MKKIDMHCHTTNRKLSGLFEESASLETIKKHMKEYEIEKTVLLATYFPHKGTGISNFRLYDWTRNENKFILFGSLDFDHFFYQGFNELEELAERKLLSGIKIYTCYQHVDLNSSNVSLVLNLAEKNLLPVMFHVGYSYSCMSSLGKVAYSEPVSPKDLEFLAEKYSGINFIFSHMGKPFFDDLVNSAKKFKNVYTDSSGILDFDDSYEEFQKVSSEIEYFVSKCGPEKLLFGTDFPVQTHKDSVNLVENAMKGFSNEDKYKVYYENARRLLKL